MTKSAGQNGAQVEITGSRRVETGDLLAFGGSLRDPADPFWQVGADGDGIMLNGAASPTPKTMVHLPPVRSEIEGNTEIWRTEAQGQSIEIRATRERCVRPDGFVYRHKVVVTVGRKTFETCAHRGGDPQETKG